jgi:hypothetical protein
LPAFRDVFPQGVINIIYGEDHKVIPPLIASGTINVLGLIGTSKTANALKKRQHPHPNRLRCVKVLGSTSTASASGDRTRFPSRDVKIPQKERFPFQTPCVFLPFEPWLPPNRRS